MTIREDKLEDALKAFMKLRWDADQGPEPTCFLVYPLMEARDALKQAGILLTGKSPFAADHDGAVMVIKQHDPETNENFISKMVWLGGMAYSERDEHLVPEKFKEIFKAALENADIQQEFTIQVESTKNANS